MKDMKLSNIQKESEKIKLKKEINEFEDLKAKSLLKLGIMTFDKIRKNEIVNKDFDEICEEIKKFDIYKDLLIERRKHLCHSTKENSLRVKFKQMKDIQEEEQKGYLLRK